MGSPCVHNYCITAIATTKTITDKNQAATKYKMFFRCRLLLISCAIKTTVPITNAIAPVMELNTINVTFTNLITLLLPGNTCKIIANIENAIDTVGGTKSTANLPIVCCFSD